MGIEKKKKLREKTEASIVAQAAIREHNEPTTNYFGKGQFRY
jgi:hypothetical protein